MEYIKFASWSLWLYRVQWEMFQIWENTIFTLIYTLQAQTEVMHVWANVLLFLFLLFVWLSALISDTGSWPSWLDASMENLFYYRCLCWIDCSWHLWWHLALYRFNSLETHTMVWKQFYFSYPLWLLLRHILVDCCIHFSPSHRLMVVFINSYYC